MHSKTAPSFEAPLIPRSIPPKTYPLSAISIPLCTQKENEASSSSHTFNILARIIQGGSIALYQLFPATAGASKMKCRRAILSEIGLHSGYNSFLLKQNEKVPM